MEQKDRFMEALRKLNEIESSRIVLSLAIYDKKLQEIKTRKLDNIRSSLEAKIYYLPKKIKDEKFLKETLLTSCTFVAII